MKKGFTLFELILVVVLIGIIYGSVINVFENYKEKSIDVTLMSLEKYMQEFAYNSHVSLVCIKHCSECLLSVNGEFKQNVTPFLERDVTLYRYDKDLGVTRLDLLPFFQSGGQEEEACFRYEVHPDGSRTEMIVTNDKEVYSFPSYFGSVKRYDSITEAIEAYNDIRQKAAEQ